MHAIHILCISLLLFCENSQAQDHHGYVSTETKSTSIPVSLLEAPIRLTDTARMVHENVTVNSSEAQAYYDQGLAFLYSYDWIHAGRSFQEALRRDPDLGMAYLGLSFAAFGLGDRQRSEEFAKRAIQLTVSASPSERKRAELRQKQLESMSPGSSSMSYVQALDAALKEDPNNLALILLGGNAAEGTPGAIGQGGGAESVRYYNQALQLDPNNLAARHFLVHSYETIDNPAAALTQAEAYLRLAPAIPHAHHMYAHCLRRLGRLKEAIKQLEQARHLAETEFAKEPANLRYDWNYRHNLSLLAAAYQQAGQWKVAQTTVTKLFNMPVNDAPDEYYRKNLPVFLIERGLPHQALALTAQLIRSQWAVGRTFGHALAGIAYIELRGIADARRELSAAETEIASLQPVSRHMVSPWLSILREGIGLQASESEIAAAKLRMVEIDLRARPGADAWSDSLFTIEFINRLATDSGSWALAESTTQQMAEQAPDYGGTHLALATLAKHRKDKIAEERELRLATKAFAASIDRSGFGRSSSHDHHNIK